MVGAPGPGSGAASTDVPPSRLNPLASTRIPSGTRAFTPPMIDTLVRVTSRAASSACLRSRSAPPIRLITTTCRPIRHGPDTFSPPIGDTCQVGVAGAPVATAFPAGTGPPAAGRSVSSTSSSARVLAVLARSIRSLNSSRVSRPSPVASRSRSTVASRSWSDARIPSPGFGRTASPQLSGPRRHITVTTYPARGRSLPRGSLDGHAVPGKTRLALLIRGVLLRRLLAGPDQRDPHQDERAARELDRRRQLPQRQPGEQDREQHLGHPDERGQLGPEPPGRTDPGHVADGRRERRQAQHRD